MEKCEFIIDSPWLFENHRSVLVPAVAQRQGWSKIARRTTVKKLGLSFNVCCKVLGSALVYSLTLFNIELFF